jgi:hypothetical protein
VLCQCSKLLKSILNVLLAPPFLTGTAGIKILSPVDSSWLAINKKQEV